MWGPVNHKGTWIVESGTPDVNRLFYIRKGEVGQKPGYSFRKERLSQGINDGSGKDLNDGLQDQRTDTQVGGRVRLSVSRRETLRTKGSEQIGHQPTFGNQDSSSGPGVGTETRLAKGTSGS